MPTMAGTGSLTLGGQTSYVLFPPRVLFLRSRYPPTGPWTQPPVRRSGSQTSPVGEDETSYVDRLFYLLEPVLGPIRHGYSKGPYGAGSCCLTPPVSVLTLGKRGTGPRTSDSGSTRREGRPRDPSWKGRGSEKTATGTGNHGWRDGGRSDRERRKKRHRCPEDFCGQ